MKPSTLNKVRKLGFQRPFSDSFGLYAIQEWLEYNHSIFIKIHTSTTVNEIIDHEYTLQSWRFAPIKGESFLYRQDCLEAAINHALDLIV